MKLSEKYIKEYQQRKPAPLRLYKKPMSEERYALYATVVLLIILGIGIWGFVIG
jgi:preprotein translocase subunit Sss1